MLRPSITKVTPCVFARRVPLFASSRSDDSPEDGLAAAALSPVPAQRGLCRSSAPARQLLAPRVGRQDPSSQAQGSGKRWSLLGTNAALTWHDSDGPCGVPTPSGGGAGSPPGAAAAGRGAGAVSCAALLVFSSLCS